MRLVKGVSSKALDRWTSWARRCRILVFAEWAASCDTASPSTLPKPRPPQGLIESTNTDPGYGPELHLDGPRRPRS